MSQRLAKLGRNIRANGGDESPTPSLLRLRNRNASPQVIELYRQGLNMVEVAKATGINPSSVCRILQRCGIERRSPHRRKVQECWCGKPSSKIGSLCTKHRRLAVAKASRECYRRKHGITPERQRADY